MPLPRFGVLDIRGKMKRHPAICGSRIDRGEEEKKTAGFLSAERHGLPEEKKENNALLLAGRTSRATFFAV